jgi:pantoate--beta-alanine ligase
MITAETLDQIRQALDPHRRDGRSIGFVPTMGALHAGHARLIADARSGCDAVVVSIFVNPLQFDRRDDLERYPRTLNEDLSLCRTVGADVVFLPEAPELYPTPPACTVDVGRLADHLCGPFRPGHFRGVATVVLKLLNIVRPQRAYFGEKDAQQLAIIRRMVRDFNVPADIVGVPTVRDDDGVALSSRNRLLSAEERALAPALVRALREAERRIRAGETDPAVVRAGALATIPDDPRLRLEYLELVDPEELQPGSALSGPVLAAGALWVGTTRLIDNILCRP